MTSKQLRQYNDALGLLPAGNPAKKRGLAEIAARSLATDLIIYGRDAEFWDGATRQPGPAAQPYLKKGLSEYDLYRFYVEQKEDLAQSRILFSDGNDQPGGSECRIEWYDEVNVDIRKELRDAAWHALSRTVQGLQDDIAIMSDNCPAEMLTRPRATDRLITASLTHITRWRRGEGNDADYAVAIRDEVDEYMAFIKERPQDQSPEAPIAADIPEVLPEELTPDDDPFAGLDDQQDLPF